MSCRTSHNQPVQRELFLKYQVDDSSKVTLAAYAYDNLGRLQSKSLHGSASEQAVVQLTMSALTDGIRGSKLTQEFVLHSQIT